MINKMLDNCFQTELNTRVEEVREDNGLYWHCFRDTIFYQEMCIRDRLCPGADHSLRHPREEVSERYLREVCAEMERFLDEI